MIRKEMKTDLKLVEILKLNDELEQLSRLKLSIVFKAHLSKLKRVTEKFAHDFKKLDEELIRKYGEQEGDNIIVKQDSEKWQDYIKERIELLEDQHEFTYGEIQDADFEGVESELDFPIIYKLF